MSPGKELAYVPREWDYPMCHVNGTSQSALRMGLYNVPWEWYYPMCSGKELANVPCKWD